MAALCGAAILAGAGVALAESFGPVPGPDQSRCATKFSVSRHRLVIGQTLEATAGPPTADCGGPSTSVRWGWPLYTTDISQTQTPGLIETHPCPSTSSHCEFKAVIYTQPGVWQSVGIGGTSPQGGWGASDYYAVLTQNYREMYGSVGAPGIFKVTVSGPRRRQTVTTSRSGQWYLLVRPGTYAVSAVVHDTKIKITVKVANDPGVAVNANF
jgi:hypothetical protein